MHLINAFDFFYWKKGDTMIYCIGYRFLELKERYGCKYGFTEI